MTIGYNGHLPQSDKTLMACPHQPELAAIQCSSALIAVMKNIKYLQVLHGL